MAYTEQDWFNGGPGAFSGPRMQHIESGIGGAHARLDAAEADIDELQARAAFQLNVRDFGAVGDGVTDDTVAIQAALTEAAGTGTSNTVFIPAGSYLISATLKFRNNVSISGEAWSWDPVHHRATELRADTTFTGAAVLQQDPGPGLVSAQDGSGGLIPDESWHWGVIEKLYIKGNGLDGPHGIDAGWFGEASTIRNVEIWNCNSAIYLSGPQASASIEVVSLFSNRIGLNCDDISSTVRVFGLSGDNNTHLLRVKGGYSTNVTIVGLKGESYDADTGDPMIKIEDLAGGAVTIVGGWCDTASDREAVIEVSNPSNFGPVPRITLINFAANTNHYDKLINDVYANVVVPINYQNGHALISYNGRIAALGGGGMSLGYARSLNGTTYDAGGEGTEYPLIGGGPDNSSQVFGGPGTGGVMYAHDPTGLYPVTKKVVEWGTGNNPNLGFYGQTPITQQTVTGSRDSGAALADLLNKLAALGLIVNNSTT